MLNDSHTSYGWISILAHWIGAVLVIALFIIGQQMEDLEGPEKIGILTTHISIGLLAFPLLFARTFWRAGKGKPVVVNPGNRFLEMLANLVMMGLLLAIFVAIMTGPLAVWSGGRGLGFFGLFEIPSPIGRIGWLHEGAEEVHEIASKLILPLFVLHVLGALKHLVIDRDGRFMRIVRPLKSD